VVVVGLVVVVVVVVGRVVLVVLVLVVAEVLVEMDVLVEVVSRWATTAWSLAAPAQPVSRATTRTTVRRRPAILSTVVTLRACPARAPEWGVHGRSAGMEPAPTRSKRIASDGQVVSRILHVTDEQGGIG
jgi:hypothetical protein